MRQRNQLRDTMHQQGRTLEQIATAMAHQFKDRPRQAWRHAHGWTQQDVADHYNHAVKDSNMSMTANRVRDFGRWPINGAEPNPLSFPPSPYWPRYMALPLEIYRSPRPPKMTNGGLIGLAVVDSGVIPHQLPSAISNFVGRTYELDILNAQLEHAAEGAGMVLITSIGGTAGIGKTTLALYWARSYMDQFPDGHLYEDLRGFSPGGKPSGSRQPHGVVGLRSHRGW
ncbi:MAG: ATP-binding protein [Pseudonocardiaceae bacterium]